MSTTNITMYNDQELPSLSLAWTDATGALIDFSSGWTFTVKLSRTTAPATTLYVKTSGITGSNGSSGSNLVIDWSTTDWAGLEAAVNGTSYFISVVARRTSDTKDRYFKPDSPITLKLKAAPGTSAVSPSSYPVTVDASTVTFTPSGSLVATNAQTAITEASTDLDAHINKTTGAHAASAISFTPTGYVASTTVQAAIAEAGADAGLWPWGGYDAGIVRDLATGTTLVTLTKDKYCFRTFIAPADMIVTGVQMCSTGTVSAGLTLCRFFLGQVSPVQGDATPSRWRYTLLARTASDTTMFNSANTLYSRSFSNTGGWPTSVRLIKGQTYTVGYMISGTTAPTVVSAAAFMRPQINVFATTEPPLGGYPAGIEAYTDLPPYVAGASTIYDGTATSPWFGLIADPTSTKARPTKTVALGDSFANSYGGWAGEGNVRAGSPLSISLWAGYSGQQTDYILTQIATTTAQRPSLVIVSCGVNDIANTIAASVVQSNLTAIATALTAAGAKVIICTIPPSTFMDAGELVTLAAVNGWLKSTFSMTNVWVSDTGNALTTGDGVTRNAALYTDGVHPNFAGCAAMGAVLATTITTAIA